jgi:uncharacterized membrane protein
MNKNRFEAFSDGVLAIIITIMVLEFKTPNGSDWIVLKPLLPKFIAYGLSFAYVGIYWGNHHHMLQSVKHISAKMILANLNLLFWISLIPFATAWMSMNEFSPNTTAFYGFILLLCAISYTILQKSVERNTHEIDSLTAAYKIMSKKGYISTTLYIISIPISYLNPFISLGFLSIVALIWLVPDRNIEKSLKSKN